MISRSRFIYTQQHTIDHNIWEITSRASLDVWITVIRYDWIMPQSIWMMIHRISIVYSLKIRNRKDKIRLDK
jgi:hypothetical protein